MEARSISSVRHLEGISIAIGLIPFGFLILKLCPFFPFLHVVAKHLLKLIHKTFLRNSSGTWFQFCVSITVKIGGPNYFYLQFIWTKSYKVDFCNFN